MLHVRVPVTLADNLEVIAFATKQTTSDIVRDLLSRFVLTHGELLQAVANAVERVHGPRTVTQAQLDAAELHEREGLDAMDSDPDED